MAQSIHPEHNEMGLIEIHEITLEFKGVTLNCITFDSLQSQNLYYIFDEMKSSKKPDVTGFVFFFLNVHYKKSQII